MPEVVGSGRVLVTIIIQGGKAMRTAVMIFTLMFLVQPAWAMDVAGVSVMDTATVEGTSLQLNGAGVRSKFFFKIYVAELYLEKPGKEAAMVIQDQGIKRMVMHFLYDGVGPDKLVEGWNDGFAANLDSQSKEKLQKRIETFNGMFTDEMKSGDIVLFDYLPGKGTRVEIKGEVKGMIEGKDFSDALLSIWLGEKPVATDLKKDLLGR